MCRLQDSYLKTVIPAGPQSLPTKRHELNRYDRIQTKPACGRQIFGGRGCKRTTILQPLANTAYSVKPAFPLDKLFSKISTSMIALKLETYKGSVSIPF